MPALDALRKRLRVTEEELEVLRLVSNDEAGEDHAAVVKELTAAGLITDEGQIHDLVADLATSMAQPMIEFWVEAMSPQGPTLSHLVIGGDESVWYTDPWPGRAEEGLTYCRDELPQVIWILARLIGWRRATPPRDARPITGSLAVVAGLMGAFSGEDPDNGSATAISADGADWEAVKTAGVARIDDLLGEMTTEQRNLWIAVLATLEGTWRVTCAWGPGTDNVRGLAAWDCGSGGFWVRTTPPEPLLPEHITSDAEATFVPTSGADVWSALTDLLPSKAELEAGARAAGQSVEEAGNG